jgi:hypothetical protein
MTPAPGIAMKGRSLRRTAPLASRLEVRIAGSQAIERLTFSGKPVQMLL